MDWRPGSQPDEPNRTGLSRGDRRHNSLDRFSDRESTPEADWLDRELTRQRLGLTDLTLCEILQGIPDESEATSTLTELRRFELFNTGGVELAIAAARNYRVLRSHGRTVRKTIDCLIATFCLVHGHSLLHCDRDFKPFEDLLDLQVVHPS
jgi:predicted nucleic acid-binding protein